MKRCAPPDIVLTMEKCKVLAFLLCEKASIDPDGKVTLHGLFDRIIIPRSPDGVKIFFVYYKVVVNKPCSVFLRVVDPFQGELSGNWRDPLVQIGPVQGVWGLTTSLLKQAGPFGLELILATDDGDQLSLASTLLVVDKEGD